MRNPLRRNKNYFSRSRVRVVLHLLGLRSIKDLSRVSGVSHVTLSNALYYPTEKRLRSINTTTFKKIYQTLVDLYTDQWALSGEKDLMVIARTFIQTWVKSALLNISYVRQRRSTSKKQIRDTRLRSVRIMHYLKGITKSFCGEF